METSSPLYWEIWTIKKCNEFHFYIGIMKGVNISEKPEKLPFRVKLSWSLKWIATRVVWVNQKLFSFVYLYSSFARYKLLNIGRDSPFFRFFFYYHSKTDTVDCYTVFLILMKFSYTFHSLIILKWCGNCSWMKVSVKAVAILNKPTSETLLFFVC